MISTVDHSEIESALGRPPRGAQEVVARCPSGHPLSIRVKSVVDGDPFPTLYWLTCPNVSRQIDHIEGQGLVKELEKQLQSNAELCDDLKHDHALYARDRKSFLSPSESDHLRSLNCYDGFNSRGIGGIQDWSRVRCLHMHFAFLFANPKALYLKAVGLDSRILTCQ